MTTLRNAFILIALISCSRCEEDNTEEETIKFPPLERLIGHGIVPSLSPEYGPPRESEHYPGMTELLTMPFSSDEDTVLPNTWQSIPSFRYPYYDSEGQGYLVYGYGDNQVYSYSEFDDLEGYY